MTALGHVIALIRQLDDASTADAEPRADARLCDLPPAVENASSLGAVLAFIRAAADAPDARERPGDAAADRSLRTATAIARGLAAGRAPMALRT